MANREVVDIDLGYDAMFKAFRQDAKAAKIGLLDDTDEEIVHYRGYVNEFGYPEGGIPPRRAHRSTFDENVEYYLDRIIGYLVLEDPGDYDFEELLDDLGQEHTNKLIDAISSWSHPPNAKFTREKKGFDDPLIETLEMLGSIDYEVVEEE